MPDRWVRKLSRVRSAPSRSRSGAGDAQDFGARARSGRRRRAAARPRPARCRRRPARPGPPAGRPARRAARATTPAAASRARRGGRGRGDVGPVPQVLASAPRTARSVSPGSSPAATSRSQTSRCSVMRPLRTARPTAGPHVNADHRVGGRRSAELASGVIAPAVAAAALGAGQGRRGHEQPDRVQVGRLDDGQVERPAPGRPAGPACQRLPAGASRPGRVARARPACRDIAAARAGRRGRVRAPGRLARRPQAGTGRAGQVPPEQFPGAPAGDQGLGQRVGRQPVGAVHPGRRGLADGVQAGDRSPPVQVGPDAAAGVVRAGRDRDRLGGRVDPAGPAQRRSPWGSPAPAGRGPARWRPATGGHRAVARHPPLHRRPPPRPAGPGRRAGDARP